MYARPGEYIVAPKRTFQLLQDDDRRARRRGTALSSYRKLDGSPHRRTFCFLEFSSSPRHEHTRVF